MTNTRRSFMQYLTLAGVSATTLFRGSDAKAAVAMGREAAGLAEPWPEMTYRTLGRTGFKGSRLVFGCGAALSSRRQDRLLHTAFDAGVNVFDVGYKHYYDQAEKHLAPFLKQRGERIFLISKAIVPIDKAAHETPSAAELKSAAVKWSALLDESLLEMKVEHVNAYYQMGANNPAVIGSEELYRAFQDAKAAGKVSHLGLSTHQNAEAVLTKAIETGWFDLAQIAVTPGGWYDWETRKVLPDSPPMHALRPLFDRARNSGIALIGMKAGRFLAGRNFLGAGDSSAFDGQYSNAFLKASLSPFQRSYAYVLANGLDAVNADMQNMPHLKENFIAAATSHTYFPDEAGTMLS